MRNTCAPRACEEPMSGSLPCRGVMSSQWPLGCIALPSFDACACPWSAPPPSAAPVLSALRLALSMHVRLTRSARGVAVSHTSAMTSLSRRCTRPPSLHHRQRGAHPLVTQTGALCQRRTTCATTIGHEPAGPWSTLSSSPRWPYRRLLRCRKASISMSSQCHVCRGRGDLRAHAAAG